MLLDMRVSLLFAKAVLTEWLGAMDTSRILTPTTAPSHTWRRTCSYCCLMEGVNRILAGFRVPCETCRAPKRAYHLSYQQSWRQKDPAYGAAHARAYRTKHKDDPLYKQRKSAQNKWYAERKAREVKRKGRL